VILRDFFRPAEHPIRPRGVSLAYADACLISLLASTLDSPPRSDLPTGLNSGLNFTVPMRIPPLVLSAVSVIVFTLATTTGRAMSPRPAANAAPARVITPFDADWRFLQSNTPIAAEQPAFADSAWRTLNVPHDWSIEGPFDQNAATRGSGAFLPSGVAWYRKHFSLPPAFASRRVFIEFDGIMQNSDVWINGQLLGHRPFGYVSFRYELTGKLNFGDTAANVLTVRADTSAQPASRWYSGAGIYRHVRLVVTDPVHLDQWATFVTTPDNVIPSGPSMSTGSAVVRVQTSVLNQSAATRDVTLHITVLDPSGKAVATADTAAHSVAAGQSAAFQHDIPLTNPQFWDIATPRLYRAVVAVRAGTTTLDDETVTFGIRTATFDAATGFSLNGRTFKLYGVCVHQDGGAFGVAVPLAVWEQRLTALRSLGVNAIRTAHNPPDPGFLDLCDRLGFLVMDELFDCWTVAKNPQDYHLFFNEWSKTDARDTVRRDRNHPSVVLWSSGNEIHDTPKEELAKQILAGLVAVFHEADSTRPVTQALFRPNTSHDYTNGLADLLDVIGTNYRDPELLAAWRAKPTRKIIGTEQGHTRQTWLMLRDNPAEAGQFLWSGIDYLGEARAWPNVSSGSGLLDRTGAVKPMALERASWWSPNPVVHMVRRTGAAQRMAVDPGFAPLMSRQVQFPDWTPRDPSPHDENVEVYSNCDDVELFLNDKSLGSQPINRDASPRIWKVAYAAGTLRAVANNAGKVVATEELRTAGAPAKILLTIDHPRLLLDWEDVVPVTAMVVDANGVRVPTAADTITFAVSGPGVIAAVDSADSTSHEPFQASARKAFNGRCVAFIRATASPGKITLTASAPGLTAGTVSLDVAKAP
jgi:beta-galactosidase